MITFDEKTYFDMVRKKPFGGSMSQSQVDGQNTILAGWVSGPGVTNTDLRHLAYSLATTMHETASEMQPIEEYGKGEGMSYGKKDPETGQTYYGRGYVQLTWRDNYARATEKLGLSGDDDLEWHASMALDPDIAAQVMFQGMEEGWFRSSDGKPETLSRYFNSTTDDAYNAREIINGDKTKVPSWSGGVNIGNLIKGYHNDFLAALTAAAIDVEPAPEPERRMVTVSIITPDDVDVEIVINGERV